MGKWLSRIGIGLIALVVVLGGVNWLSRMAGSLPAPPQPNGYDQLLAAARATTKVPADVADLSPGELFQLAANNKPALDQARAALATPCAVPLAVGNAWLQKHQAEAREIERLAAVFGVEARAAVLQNHADQAARDYLDMIRLGQVFFTGGVMFDGLIGLALEANGAGSLDALVPKLDAAGCREAAGILEEIEARRIKPGEVLATEKKWSAKSSGILVRLVSGKSAPGDEAEFTKRAYKSTQRLRRVLIRLAARACELETGKKSTSATDLVPTYLKAMPLDPATGAPMTEGTKPVKGKGG